jgi:hypothetical protein
MKKVIKLFGIILGISTLYSILFYAIADRSQPFYSDMGVLEALVFILAIIASGIFDILIISLIISSALFYLKKKKKINLDNKILFLLSYLKTVIIIFLLYMWFISKGVAEINIEHLTRILFSPLIHTIISFNLANYIFNKKKK